MSNSRRPSPPPTWAVLTQGSSGSGADHATISGDEDLRDELVASSPIGIRKRKVTEDEEETTKRQKPQHGKKPQAMFESLSKSDSFPRRMNLARKRTTVPKFAVDRTPQMGRENPKKDGPSKVMKKEATRMSAEQGKVRHTKVGAPAGGSVSDFLFTVILFTFWTLIIDKPHEVIEISSSSSEGETQSTPDKPRSLIEISDSEDEAPPAQPYVMGNPVDVIVPAMDEMKIAATSSGIGQVTRHEHSQKTSRAPSRKHLRGVSALYSGSKGFFKGISIKEKIPVQDRKPKALGPLAGQSQVVESEGISSFQEVLNHTFSKNASPQSKVSFTEQSTAQIIASKVELEVLEHDSFSQTSW
ncbi:hypothetical protein NLI96_g3547 [Meripilus lineatus]|uniref:Uncharacterized protein n=1 Tax=Meripilus lineatus TaxID=2056292 RepID=A0AAD5V820_9APHY|nr:hypothetical protein NLI96_g3547 [Physisporinus lineatus]